MATKETQNLILSTALALFNEHGTAKVSANRVADACGLSRGNVHYHFNNKQSIINALYCEMSQEIRVEWADDTSHPTIAHMLEMFDRQLELIWRYRFFYRELVALLAADRTLQQKFSHDRQERTELVVAYFEALVEKGVLHKPRQPDRLRNLTKLSWIFCDNWINYISVDEFDMYPECRAEGHELLLELFRPYFTPHALAYLERQPSAAGSRRVAGGD
jgi:AcrR family transcriptional regulator